MTERTKRFEDAWKEELKEFAWNSFWEEEDEFRTELAQLFEVEVSDEKKSSYTWSLYEIMNCLSDSELSYYGVSITEVAESVESLVDRYKLVKKNFLD